MDEANEGISVNENSFATFIPNTDVIREVINKGDQGTDATEDIDDTWEITPVSSTEGFIELMDLTDDDITTTENFETISGRSRLGISGIGDEIIEVKMERREDTDEIMEQANEGISMIENIEAIPLPSTERIDKISDKIDDSFRIIETLKTIPVSDTEVFTKTMDLYEVSKAESLVDTFESNPNRINGIIEQANEGISAIENIEAMPLPSTEKTSEISDKIDESFRVIENLKTISDSGMEVFTKTTDLDEVSITESLVAIFESNPKRINEIMEQKTEDISVVENIETTAVPTTERINEINDKIDERFEVIEISEAIPSSSTSVNEILVPNEYTTKTMFDKVTRNMGNEAKNETSIIIHGEAKKLKTVNECKRKGRKRKFSHPPVSEMLMDSLKSIKKVSGVSFEDIKTHMEENFQVTVKALLKYHVNNFLLKWVEDGILEKVDEADMGARYKIK